MRSWYAADAVLFKAVSKSAKGPRHNSCSSNLRILEPVLLALDFELFVF